MSKRNKAMQLALGLHKLYRHAIDNEKSKPWGIQTYAFWSDKSYEFRKPSDILARAKQVARQAMAET